MAHKINGSFCLECKWSTSDWNPRPIICPDCKSQQIMWTFQKVSLASTPAEQPKANVQRLTLAEITQSLATQETDDDEPIKIEIPPLTVRPLEPLPETLDATSSLPLTTAA